MAAPTVANHALDSDGNTTVSWGVGATAGNVLVVVATRRDGGGSMSASTGGWATDVAVDGGGDANDDIAIFSKLAAGGETSMSFNAGGGNGECVVVEIAGADYASRHAAGASIGWTGYYAQAVTPDAGKDAIVIGATSNRVAGDGPNPATIWGAVDSGATELRRSVVWAHPYVWVGYRPVTAASGAYSAGVSGQGYANVAAIAFSAAAPAGRKRSQAIVIT